MSPMPPPASAHPAMSTAGDRWPTAVIAAIAIAEKSSVVPMSVMRALPMRSPKRPCTSAATAHASAAAVRPSPAHVGEKSYSSISRYGHVDLGAEQRAGDQAAHQHDARQSAPRDERPARQQRS